MIKKSFSLGIIALLISGMILSDIFVYAVVQTEDSSVSFSQTNNGDNGNHWEWDNGNHWEWNNGNNDNGNNGDNGNHWEWDNWNNGNGNNDNGNDGNGNDG